MISGNQRTIHQAYTPFHSFLSLLWRFNKTKALKIEEIEFGMEGSKIEIPVNSLYLNGIELVRVSL